MPTTYTPILQLALPATGELNGTWGTTVNDNITSMVEQAIAGLATISTWTAASHTLTTANGTTSEARCAILQCSGAPGAAATVICPTASKVYIIKNSVTGGYAVTLKTSAGTGVSVANGVTALLYCDGTNVVSGDFNGDVVGPASATDTAIATFDGVTGKLIKNNASTTIAANVITALGFSGPLNGTVGATTPAAGAFTTLSATGITTVAAGSAALPAIVSTTGTADTGIFFPAADTVAASTAGSERLRIDSSGNVGVGTSNTPSNRDTVTPKFIVNGAGVAGSMQVVRNTTPGVGGSIVELSATRGSDVNSYTILQSGDGIGSIIFGGADGTQFTSAASIFAAVDGTPGANDMPGRLVFSTTADNAGTVTERMRIDSSGNVGVGTSSPSAKLSVVGTAYSPNITLTDAATVAWDTSTGQVATFTFVSTNRTMGAPTNLKDGAFYALAVIQNGGSNTLTFNSVFKWASGTAPTLSTAAGAKDYFTFRSDGVSLFQQGISQAVA
jgi:hypothetical protein